MSQKQRLVFFAVTALQLLVAGVRSEEQTACESIRTLSCASITSELVQRCIQEKPQIDDVRVPYFGTADIEKELEGPGNDLNLTDPEVQQSSGLSGASDLQHNAVCTWSYKNHFDDHRIPSNISHATCTNTGTMYTLGGNSYQCRKIWYPMNVLKWTCSRENGVTELDWTFTHEPVSFGCSLERLKTN